MQNNNDFNNINTINISSSVQETETATISLEDQKLRNQLKDMCKQKDALMDETNKKYKFRIKHFPTRATVTYKDNKNENNITISLQEYYDNVISRVRKLMFEINDGINIHISFRIKESEKSKKAKKEKGKVNIFGDEKFLKEKFKLYEKLFFVYDYMEDLVNFYVDFFNKIKNEDIKKTEQIDVNDFEIKFLEKLDFVRKKDKEFKDALEEYRVKRKYPVPEEEDLIFREDIEKYGEYLKNSEYWFNINVDKLRKANEKIKRIYENSATYLKETEDYNKKRYKDVTNYVKTKIEFSDFTSFELFENGECKKGKKKEFINFLKDVDRCINFINNFINQLQKDSLNFNAKEFEVIYKAEDEDSKLNNIVEEETKENWRRNKRNWRRNKRNWRRNKKNNINSLVKEINEKFNTTQEGIPNDVNLLLKKENELLKEVVLKEVAEDNEIVKISPSSYYALLSKRVKSFTTKLNILINKWNYYAKQKVNKKFVKEKIEINEKIFKLCEDLNQIIEFYMGYFNLIIKKINTNKEANHDMNKFENKFSEKLESLEENLVEIENKIEEFRENQSIAFFKNKESKPKIDLNGTTPFSSYVSSEESNSYNEDENENENENENVIINIERVPLFEKSQYFESLNDLKLLKNLIKIENIKETEIFNDAENYYNNLKEEKVPLQDILNEQIDEINNNERLNDKLKKAEIRDIKNINNNNKYEKTDAINIAGVMVRGKDDAYMKKQKRKIINIFDEFLKGRNTEPRKLNITKEEELKIINMVNADELLKNNHNYEKIRSGILSKLSNIDDFVYAVGITKEELELFKKSEFYKPEVIENIKKLIYMAETKKLPKQDIETLVKAIEKYKYLFKEFLNINDKGFVNEKGEITSKFEITSAESYKNKFKEIIKEIEKSIMELMVKTKIIEKK